MFMSEPNTAVTAAQLPPVLRIVLAVWRGRFTVFAGVAVTVIAAAIVSFIIPATYESVAMLVLLPSPVKQSGSEMAELMSKGLSVADYEILLHSDGVLMQAADEIRQRGKWSPDDLEELEKIEVLRKRLTIETTVTQKSAYGSAYSPVIELHAEAGTPEQAKELAEAWAVVAEKLSSELSRRGQSGSIDFLREKFATASDELTKINTELRDFEIDFNDELEEARLKNMHERRLTYEESLIDLRMTKEGLAKEIEMLKEKLAAEDERFVLWQSAPMTAVFMEGIAQGARGGTLTDDQRKAGYETEVINPLWDHLRDKLSGKEIELHGVEEHERQLIVELEAVGKELSEQREMVARKQYDYKQLSLMLLPRKTSYDQLSMKLEQAKIAEEEEKRLSDIKIISEPIESDKKVRPLRSLIVIGAGLVGLMLSTIAVAMKSELDRLGSLG